MNLLTPLLNDNNHDNIDNSKNDNNKFLFFETLYHDNSLKYNCKPRYS